MAEPKQYINGVFITEKTFQDGGSILKMSIPADKIDALAEQLKLAATDGWTRLVITRLREPKLSKTSGKVTSTHSLSVDQWQPGQPAKPQPISREAAVAGVAAMRQELSQSDDVPF